MALITRLRLAFPKIGLFGPSANTVMGEEIRRAMETAVLLGQREVATRTPVGATGILRGSIASEVRGVGATIRGIVTTPQSYALPVEESSRPHWAPIGPLLLWARRKLGDDRAAYRVRWAIHLRGTKGAHMFREGTAALRPKLPAIFAQAVERARQRLGG